ncbi:HEPN domain-containing protein [Paracoccus methylovorus]|uniref:HEPN domain-containing protein n=1 Tax=Paracoccus methylovorus TaxID=2812658 RepID=A0ABX7JJM8_9RHOB|nr:HEPN domain-containing protein [Paracoccus methylovorus]QRZ14723.1 HEPN domain-containing protein [Paracoccus methylovorus]
MGADDRTSAFGLFNFAHTYWVSAVELDKIRREVSHPDSPVQYLYYHAIELYLKAFLRFSGSSVLDLRSIGHKLVRLYEASVGRGLPDDEETREVCRLVDSNYISARYISAGYYTRATNKALWGVCRTLHDDIEPKVNATQGVTRIRHIPLTE